MTLNKSDNSTSIFEGGKLRPGIYKIQSVATDTYLDIHLHSKELCCRPAQNLKEGAGLWEIKQFGPGYTVRRLDPGKPEQFCYPVAGIENLTALYVTIYPVAWRIEQVNDGIHCGLEYVRFYWGPTQKAWDLDGGKNDNGRKVQSYDLHGGTNHIWRLIPVDVEGMFTPGPPPPLYDGARA